MQNKQIYSYKNISVSFQAIGTGKPMVILHGWGSNSEVMMPLADQLKQTRTCYLIDLPGFGNTPEPEHPWNVDDYANLVQQFIQDQGLGTVDMLVHSFGGRIALKLCARQEGGQLIDKVLITGGAGMKPRRGFDYYLRKYTAKALKAPFLILPPPLRQKALEKLRKTAVWKALGSSDYSKLSGVMRETFVRTVSEYLEPCLPKISHEVLLLWGENDGAAPLYQARRMEKGIQNAALVVIDHAGHYAFLDRPSHFASITKAFLKE